MGRHSAPDDPDDDGQDAGATGATALAVRETAQRRPVPGRHARPDLDAAAAVAGGAGDSDLDTLLDDAPLDESPQLTRPHDAAPRAVESAPSNVATDVAPIATSPSAASRTAGPAAVRGAAHNSAADLRLVRSHPSVLALCALALVVPFVAELVVLLVRGELSGHRFLVWVWIPLIVAGVLVGTVLDVSHRRHAGPSHAPPSTPDQ